MKNTLFFIALGFLSSVHLDGQEKPTLLIGVLNNTDYELYLTPRDEKGMTFSQNFPTEELRPAQPPTVRWDVVKPNNTPYHLNPKSMCFLKLTALPVHKGTTDNALLGQLKLVGHSKPFVGFTLQQNYGTTEVVTQIKLQKTYFADVVCEKEPYTGPYISVQQHKNKDSYEQSNVSILEYHAPITTQEPYTIVIEQMKPEHILVNPRPQTDVYTCGEIPCKVDYKKLIWTRMKTYSIDEKTLTETEKPMSREFYDSECISKPKEATKK